MRLFRATICFLVCFSPGGSFADAASPFPALRAEAKRVNLMGSTRPTGQGFSGNRQRPSYKEASAAKGRFIDLVGKKLQKQTLPGTGGLKPIDITVFQLDQRQARRLNKHIRGGLQQIASGRLSGARVAKYETRVDVLANGFYSKGGRIGAGNKRIRTLAGVAHNLSYAVAFLEGNLPPNDLGYIPDQTVSLPRKDEIVRGRVQRAYDVIKQNPSILGPNTKKIFNDVVNRLNPNMPTFMGYRVNEKPLPTL
jgi:hypothetical protein